MAPAASMNYTVRPPGRTVLVDAADLLKRKPRTYELEAGNLEPSLLERVAAGDRDAVADCMDRFGNLVWSLARRMLGSRADAEDVVQEIFIDLWKNASRYDASIAKEETFVAMIARRRLIDRLRKVGREPGTDHLDEALPLPAPAAETRIEASAEASRIVELFGELKPEQSQVLQLSIYGGLTHSDISEKLNLPLGTVKTHVRRGLIRIRELMQEPSVRDGRGVSP